MNKLNENLKIGRQNSQVQKDVASGKIVKGVLYETRDFKLVPVKLLELEYKGKTVNDWIVEVMKLRAEKQVLTEEITKTCKAHDVEYLNDIKTSKSHIPLSLTLNNNKVVMKAEINYNIHMIENKSEIPKDINKGYYIYNNGELSKDESKEKIMKGLV